jgi:hypothetical protein
MLSTSVTPCSTRTEKTRERRLMHAGKLAKHISSWREHPTHEPATPQFGKARTPRPPGKRESDPERGSNSAPGKRAQNSAPKR